MRRALACAAAAVLAAAAVAACSPADGTLRVTAYGEEFIEEGIPADVFSDGWSVGFGRFLVALGDVSAARGDATPDLEDDAVRVLDLARPSGGAGHLVLAADVPGGRYDEVDFRIGPATAAATAGNATADDVALLVAGDFSVYVEGTASKGTTAKTFAWGFHTATRYAGCESTAEVDGGEATSQITIHADHLFYDDLFSAEGNVAFDLIAEADAQGDADGTVTEDELRALDISTLERYQVGSTRIDNLWDFIAYLTGSLAHIDGEGSCRHILPEEVP